MNTDTATVLELEQQPAGTHQAPALRTEGQLVQQATPSNILERAYMAGADPATLAQLLQLKKEYEADEARKAFVVAMAQFKQNPPEIIKDKLVSFEDRNNQTTSYYHATLASVCAAAIKGLADVGISHRWEVDQTAGQIAVSCVLTHAQGHSERVTMAAGADTSGKKNSIQAVASTVTYLQRYTLLAITGLATKDQDDDGAKHKEKIADWVDEYLEAIDAAADLPHLMAAWQTAAAASRRKQDRDAYAELKARVQTRCGALGISEEQWAAAAAEKKA